MEGRLRMSHLCRSGCPHSLCKGQQGGVGIFFFYGGAEWGWPSQRCFWGDKLGTVSQMGTLEWVKPALKRAAPFSPTVTLHSSIQAELRAPLAEIQKGQNHSFTLPHSHLCIPCVCMSVRTVQHRQRLTNTHQKHTHTPRHKTAPFWSHRVATSPPPAHRHIGRKTWMDIVQMQL